MLCAPCFHINICGWQSNHRCSTSHSLWTCSTNVSKPQSVTTCFVFIFSSRSIISMFCLKTSFHADKTASVWSHFYLMLLVIVHSLEHVWVYYTRVSYKVKQSQLPFMWWFHRVKVAIIRLIGWKANGNIFSEDSVLLKFAGLLSSGPNLDPLTSCLTRAQSCDVIIDCSPFWQIVYLPLPVQWNIITL